MELDQTFLLDMLHDVIENLEWSVQEIEQLRKSVYPTSELQKRHLADRPEAKIRLNFLHALRQRIAAVTRDIRREHPECDSLHSPNPDA
jgi:hypothetical protein